MLTQTRKNGGWLFVEITVSVAVLSILLISATMVLQTCRKSNHRQLVRQRCIAACRAQLDSIAVTGSRIGDEDFKRLWPRVSVSIEQSEGTGQWKGLKLVKITTLSRSLHKQVKVQLSRYMLHRQEIR